MTDAEQIESWRSDFEIWCKLNGHNTELHQGKYLNFNTYKAWIVWVAAKRSQPVIELPKPEAKYGDDYSYEGEYYYEDIVFDAITAAGYKYKVKS
jgi:hypothetical protein